MLRLYRKRRWVALAALTLGTATQVSACQQEAALLGLRTAFTSFTLPINTLIQQFIYGLV